MCVCIFKRRPLKRSVIGRFEGRRGERKGEREGDEVSVCMRKIDIRIIFL